MFVLVQLSLPSADLDLDVGQFARIVCSLVDIPVYDNIVESLHVLFTLYAEFKQNQHLMNIGGPGGAAAGGMGAMAAIGEGPYSGGGADMMTFG